MKLLLHMCCGPCSCYPVKKLRADGIEPVGYFFNPNIHPYKEWEMRLKTAREFAEKVQMEFFADENYRLRDFLKRALPAEAMPNGRCTMCYTWRLEEATRFAAEHGFDLLLTAHNANDNAETLLLNLVRGTGRRGLGAIRPYGAVEGEGAMSAALKVSRPLLSVERSEIEEYAKENNLRYCIDRTNFENDYSRNRIRNQVLPILRQLNPSVISSLNKDIRCFRELNSVVDELLEDRLQSLLAIGQGHGGRGVLDALRRRFLVFSAEAAKLVSYGNTGFYVAELFRRFDIRILRDQTEGIARCLTEEVPQSKAASKIFYAGSHTAVIERGQLKVYSLPADFVAASESEDRTGLDKTVSISSCGTYSFGPYKILVEEVALQAQGKSFPQTLQAQGKSVLDAAKLSFPLTLRTVQDGDRFSPYGLKGSKKVSDFLNSRKTDLVFKNILPVITQKDGSIVCLPSFEIDDRFKVTSLSKKILTVCVSQ